VKFFSIAVLLAAFLTGFCHAQARSDNAPAVVTLKSVDGRPLDAVILGAKGESVIIQRADRRKFTLPMAQFDLDSQKIIAANLLPTLHSVPLPEVGARLFIPKTRDQDRVPASVYVAIAQSGSFWWPRLHIGDFSDKPARFRKVIFSNSSGDSVEIDIPESANDGGKISGGKTWTAVEFSVDDDVLRELAPIVAQPRQLTALATDSEGTQTDISAYEMQHLGASIAIYLRLKAFASDPLLTKNLPPIDDLSASLYTEASPPPSPDPFYPTRLDGTRVEEPIVRFGPGVVETRAASGKLNVWPIDEFRTPDMAELLSRQLESSYFFWTGFDTGLEYFFPRVFGSTEARNWIPCLELGREKGSWRPLLWLKIPTEFPIGDSLDKIRVFVDDEPPFALSSTDLTSVSADPDGTVHYMTAFHATGPIGREYADLVENAHRIRLQLIDGSESGWFELRPEEVYKMREAVTIFKNMNKLYEAGLASRPLL